MNKDQALALRKPFPEESVGKLPKGGVMLDYVGHAAVTDRLLTVDPEWSWEPFALDDHGLPALDRAGNLWIRLTICGVTRVGVGDGKSAKEAIGDAIRNAAMRFGVALDLWAKENLVEFAQAARSHQVSGAVEAAAGSPPPVGAGAPPAPESDPDGRAMVTRPQLAKVAAQMRDLGITERAAALELVTDVVGRPIASRSELTRAEASRLVEYLALQLGEVPEPQEAS